MPLSWNEIKTPAIAFTNEWRDEVSEDAEAKSFWDDFFNVFGIGRRRVATFEQQVNLTVFYSASPSKIGELRPVNLADLYDPNTMRAELVKAHQALDKAVDLCYRPRPFINETKRIEFLFELYDKYTSGMFVKIKKQKR